MSLSLVARDATALYITMFHRVRSDTQPPKSTVRLPSQADFQRWLSLQIALPSIQYRLGILIVIVRNYYDMYQAV